eukprot:scaffold103006_cov66-Phaeocystis_antarctica.AAC.6
MCVVCVYGVCCWCAYAHVHVVCCGHLGDLHGDLVALGDLAEDRVLRRARREPVEVGVVNEVHEELTAARMRSACAQATPGEYS